MVPQDQELQAEDMQHHATYNWRRQHAESDSKTTMMEDITKTQKGTLFSRKASKKASNNIRAERTPTMSHLSVSFKAHGDTILFAKVDSHRGASHVPVPATVVKAAQLFCLRPLSDQICGRPAMNDDGHVMICHGKSSPRR